jgi:hypothetical protein
VNAREILDGLRKATFVTVSLHEAIAQYVDKKTHADGSFDLARAVRVVETVLPKVRWCIGKPSMFDGLKPKVRKQKPYEAIVVVGEFATKSFQFVAVDAATPDLALMLALFTVLGKIEEDAEDAKQKLAAQAQKLKMGY